MSLDDQSYTDVIARTNSHPSIYYGPGGTFAAYGMPALDYGWNFSTRCHQCQLVAPGPPYSQRHGDRYHGAYQWQPPYQNFQLSGGPPFLSFPPLPPPNPTSAGSFLSHGYSSSVHSPNTPFWQLSSPTTIQHVNADSNSITPGFATSRGNSFYSDIPHPMPNVQNQRGPPRKPAQGRYAIWVGNIPSGTHILELRDYFVIPELAADILSVVLMPHSQSGFVNFRSSKWCGAAIPYLNKFVLNGTFLNCRFRRPIQHISQDSSDAVLAQSPSDSTDSILTENSSIEDTSKQTSKLQEGAERAKDEQNATSQPRSERFFLVKSLTAEELIASVNSGRWATQSQNEDMLNEAYKSSDSVYLIFSVNKSGEFFGYARMSTVIKEFSSLPESVGLPTNHDQSGEFALSDDFRTPATNLFPEGRIVDDLCRGRVFWEVYEPISSGSDTRSGTGIRSFKIRWMSLRKLPFSQARNLRNPWNGNKAVKIGRDGTELETQVGRALCNLFHCSAGEAHG